MITFEQIYTRLRSAVKAVNANTFCTATYVAKPTQFPCVYIRDISTFTPDGVVTLANTQKMHDCTIEVQISSNLKSGAKSEADALARAFDDAMQSMFFTRTALAPIDNADPNIYRVVGRYRRIIGSGEELPPDE